MRNAIIGALFASLATGLMACDETDANDPRAIDDRIAVVRQPLDAHCKVEVEGVGIIDMETDYVPGVTACENGNAPTEALKAQAVAARTFAYYKMRSGSAVIKNSQADQVYSCSYIKPSERHFNAASETLGIVVTYKSAPICSFYVSGKCPSNKSTCVAVSSDSCADARLEGYVTYNHGKSGANVTQSTLGWVNPANNANRGCMSQNGASCLANAGWQWQDILRFYYGSDITFTKAEGTCTEGCVPSEEMCDGVDNNCNGEIDEGGVCDPVEDLWYQSSVFDKTYSDIDGDGKADACARGAAGVYCALSRDGEFTKHRVMYPLSNEEGWDKPARYSTIRLVDINGDGKGDLCAISERGLDCWLSNGTDFEEYVKGPEMLDSDGYDHVKYYSTLRFGDINGDGKDDFCARFKEGYQCYLSTGNGFSGPVEVGDMSDAQGWGKEEYYGTIRLADINGDGRADVCGRGIKGVRCWRSQGTEFLPVLDGPPWSDSENWKEHKYWSTLRFGDIDGDGLDDVCARDKEGMVCALSTGDGFSDPFRGPAWSDAQGWGNYTHYSTIRLEDVDGDGKADLCARANRGWLCHFSNGAGFEKAFEISEFSNANGWDNPTHYRTIRMADINGDGFLDVCGRNVDGVICHILGLQGSTNVVLAPPWSDKQGWAHPQYYATLQMGGRAPKACVPCPVSCDEGDHVCQSLLDGGCDPDCKNDDEVDDNEDCDETQGDCNGDVECAEGDCLPEPEECLGRDCYEGEDEDICVGECIDSEGNVCVGAYCNVYETNDATVRWINNDCGCNIRNASQDPPSIAWMLLMVTGSLLFLTRRRNTVYDIEK